MLLQVALTKFWDIYSAWDFLLLPFYLAVVVFVAYVIAKKHREKKNEYRYFVNGLIAKVLGGLFFAIIYTFHYYGGDTTNYYQSSVAMINLAYKDFGTFCSIMVGNLSVENFSHFDGSTGYPMYFMKENSFAVVRFATPFVFLGCGSFYLSTILVSCLTYSGIWKLFQVFVREFPAYIKYAAIGVLFMPSVLFWGSGIMKDSYMICALGWFVYAFYSLVKRQQGEPWLRHYVYMAIASYVMIQIKPFNFYVLGICVALWFVFELVGRVKNTVVKVMLYPLIFMLVSLAGMYVFLFVSQLAGGFYSSVDKMLEQAVVIQQDLTREAYGENSFDIGPFDPTLEGILSKTPQALEAGLFRPYPWEANNFLMMLSALENIFLIALTLAVLLTVSPLYLMRSLVKKPYLYMLSIVFSVFFAFSVGLVTANFGALVRYKIPLIPFYVTALLIIYFKYRADRETARHAPPD